MTKTVLAGEELDLIQGTEAINRYNAQVYEKNKDVNLEEVRLAFDESYLEASKLVDSLGGIY